MLGSPNDRDCDRRVAKLFDVTAKIIADLARRGIIVSAGKRGRWQLQPSVTGYVRHLRDEAAARCCCSRRSVASSKA